MTAFAALSLANNAAVAQSFTPQSIDSAGVARWLDTQSIYDAKKTVTMSVSLPKGKSSVARVKQKIVIPVMDAVDTTKKIGESYAYVELVYAKQASQTDRLDLRAYAKNLLADATTTAASTSLEGIY